MFTNVPAGTFGSGLSMLFNTMPFLTFMQLYVDCVCLPATTMIRVTD